MEFEFYVLNYNHNKQKVEMFNIFNNIHVKESTEKAVKKYLRNPKKFEYIPFRSNEESVYGFDALVKEIDRIIRSEEWSRCEYEIAVGNHFITEVKDIVREIDNGKIEKENIYDELNKISQHNDKLEKWDCYMQAKPNMKIIVYEVLRQYKEQKKKERN